MRDDTNDPSYTQETWDENAEYADPYEADEYEEYGDYEDDDLDEELNYEHNFRIAMSVFDLISMLVGLAAVLVLAALLISLFNWVQRDIAQSLSVITAPFQ